MSELNLQELLGFSGRVKISNNSLTRFLTSIAECVTHKEIVNVIKNSNYLENKQKLALLKYFRDNELYTQSLFTANNLMRYVRQCLKYLPVTKEQRMEVEYVFSKINKNRFKNIG